MLEFRDICTPCVYTLRYTQLIKFKKNKNAARSFHACGYHNCVHQFSCPVCLLCVSFCCQNLSGICCFQSFGAAIRISSWDYYIFSHSFISRLWTCMHRKFHCHNFLATVSFSLCDSWKWMLSCSYFIKLLIEKKYALPYRVLDAMVAHFVKFCEDSRTMPVIWHQSLLAFVQRFVVFQHCFFPLVWF